MGLQTFKAEMHLQVDVHIYTSRLAFFGNHLTLRDREAYIEVPSSQLNTYTLPLHLPTSSVFTPDLDFIFDALFIEHLNSSCIL